jgi:acyl transferase domain-containing protein/NADPH:quinone reductase-like Zn-dependent oxidoreductase/acyl carrier protein
MSDASNPLAGLSALKLAVMARQARERSAPVLRADPVAIVGMACRIPGGADTPESFWTLLAEGRDAIRDVPADRWRNDDWFDADLAAPGKIATRRGGFLDAIDGFDAEYFGILPREAQRMDPQQRLFLEVAIEALDDAGLTRERLRGSRAGVFIASYHSDYAQMQYADVDDIDARTLTGTLHSVLANRLSYFLDLHGPSISIDTACSSSLVATHLACQSLRIGESDLAVAGGVSLMIGPELFVSMSKVGFMSPDGRCKTFDELADGFGRGEGCGVVVLKRLADAVAEGDRVLAVIRGSAVNQDGHSTLLAAPSGPAQRRLIEEALAGAQLDAVRIGLMETHGTGTALGDPIEVEAIASTLGKPAPGTSTCLLGSAKANVGHLEAAAGVTGLIKAVLSLRHEAVPPQPNFRRLSPHISLEGTRLAIPLQLTPWPRADVPRCAAVSSFGVGGTNAHVILEEAPRLPAPQADAEALRVLPVSAHSAAALRAHAARWVDFLGTANDVEADICFTAAQRRTHHEHRLAVVGRTRQELAARLREALDQGADVAAPARLGGTAPRVAFVFSGQGPQWHAMGRELLSSEPVFRAVVERCDRLLQPLSGWSLLEELNASPERSRMDHTEVAQPALFALQAGLVALLGHWGIAPHGLVGHSVGEIAALHAAGVLTLEEAVRVVWQRGRIMQQATGLGGMAAVGIAASDAQPLLRGRFEMLGIAAVNAPNSIVLSGDGKALDDVLATLAAQGVSHRRLPVHYAFHSVQMAPFQQQLATALGAVRSAPARIDVYSTVTGTRARELNFDAQYFGRNVRETVRFADAIAAMADDGFDAFVEIGPHPVLSGSIADCLAATQCSAPVIGSLRRGRDERESMLSACAALYMAGCDPRWSALQEDSGEVVSLPAVAWQRKRHWIRPRPSADRAAGRSKNAAHPVLGTQLELAGIGAHVFEGSSAPAHDWLADHRILGSLLLPAAAVVETFATAVQGVAGVDAVALEDFAMERPLVVPDAADAPARWQTVVTPVAEGRWTVELFESVAGEAGAPSWRKVASAGAQRADASVPAWPQPATASPLATDAIYAAFDELGAAFGTTFRCLDEMRRADGQASASVTLPESLQPSAAAHLVHPVLLDAALQLCSVAAGLGTGGPARLMLPLGADRITVRRCVTPRLLARARLDDAGTETLAATFTLDTQEGERVVTVEGMRFAAARPDAFARDALGDTWLYESTWTPASDPADDAGGSAVGGWLVLCDASGVGNALADSIVARGGHCLRVTPGQAFKRVSTNHWTIDPAEPGHFRRLFDEAPAPAMDRLRAVVHLWSLDAADGRGPQGEDAARSRVADDALRAMDAALDGEALCIASTLHLTQALVGAQRAAPLWLATRGAHAVANSNNGDRRPHGASLWGLGSVIALEHPELRVRRVDLDPADDEARCASRLAGLVLSGSVPPDIALRGDQPWVPRLQRRAAAADATPGDRPVRLEVERAGTLDGLAVRPMRSASLRPGEVRLQVLAAGLNFRDVLLALGMYPGGGVPLGAECAGRVVEIGTQVDLEIGDTVFGFVPASMASEAVVPAAFLARVPNELTLEEAAGFPVAFLTALYGLKHLAGLRRGERVLIHAAAGGVGLAAVQLAQRCGAEVFATAGSDDKRALLRSLGVEHVMDSRSLAFADEVMQATAGQGVDVVLNSLAGEFVVASLRVLAKGGRFLELGKRDILTAEAAVALRPDASYRAFDLGGAALADHALLRPMLDELIGALRDGTLRPLPVRTFSFAAARDAFRHMAQARHVGKIVLRLPQRSAPLDTLVHADATYLVTGGLGAIGLETATWLADCGARHIVLSGRRAPGVEAARRVDGLRARGVDVRVVQADAADREHMGALLRAVAREMPALRGVVHAAATVHDGVLSGQRWANMQAVLAGKARGAWVLHELTRHIDLDFFVMYSAAGLYLGARGQGAYPAANAELDALAQLRRSLGLPALSVAWGAWDGGGMATVSAAQGRDAWADRGLGRIAPAEGFARVEKLLREGATCALVMRIDWARFLERLPEGADADFYRDVTPRAPQRASAGTRAAAQASLAERLQAMPAGQRREALASHLRERALHVLGLDASTHVPPRAPLKDIGLDSLMAVELRNALARSTGQSLPATLLFDYPTLDALTDHFARRLGIEAQTAARDSAAASESVAAPAAGASDIAALSDAEAEAMLLAELDGTAAKETT